MGQSTIQHGDRYEQFVASYIENMYAGKSQIAIYRKKKYPQRISSNPLEIDISIEEKIYANRDSEYDLLTIVECKNYKSAVKREVIDHLIGRKNDVRANEAICFSTSGFQKGAIDKAKDAGIKLVILRFEDLEGNWLTRKNNNRSSSLRIDELLKKFEFFDPKHYFNSRQEVYEGMDIVYLLDSIHSLDLSFAPSIAPRLLEYFSIETLKIGGFDGVINIDLLLYVIVQLGYRTELDHSLIKEGVLALCDFSNKVVRLSVVPNQGLSRYAFSLAHEIGHILLHKNVFHRVNVDKCEDDLMNEKYGRVKNRQLLEEQANRFAAYLLMPRYLLVKTWEEFKREQRIQKDVLYLDHQKVNKELYQSLLRRVNAVTIVSAEALKNRLKELGILVANESSGKRKMRESNFI
jgi:conserved hypothetical protein